MTNFHVWDGIPALKIVCRLVMYVHRRRTRIEIWTPAKLNLYLEVLGRRADGYHEVETLMVPIRRFDTLELAPRRDNKLTLVARWAGAEHTDPADRASWGELPPDEQNLAYRAVELLRQRAGTTRGLDLLLCKRIPAAAGLGGGSSDAAAALRGAALMWQLDWSTSRLSELAAELGSDVPFFLYDSAAVCRGRGEQVQPVALRARPHFVVLRPPAGLSTGTVYAHTESPASPRRWSDTSVTELRRPRDLAACLFNRLQAAAERLAPWLDRVRQQFNRLDLLGHQMSGSGSAYFGICRNARHARRVAAVLRSRCAGYVFCAAVAAKGYHSGLSATQI